MENKICLVNEKKYTYHSPGNTASRILLNHLSNIEVIDEIPDDFDKYLKINNFNTVIFLNVPTLKPTIFEISKIKKTINVGMYFDDSAQYFNNWFRYLTQVIDFALCWEPTDVSLFETYGVPSAHLPGLFNTYIDKILDQKQISWDDRIIDCIHIGRMDRPGRNSLQLNIQNEFKNSEFWGEGTINGYISDHEYVNKLFNSKIAINNSGCAKYNFVRKSDVIEWRRRQYKGKLFHYFLSQCVVLTQDSPLLEKYFQNGSDLMIYKNDEDLISKIDLLLKNPNMAKEIAISGYNKALGYIDENLNLKNFRHLLKRSSLKKNNKPMNDLYIDKYFVRSIAAFDGNNIISSYKNFRLFIKTYKLLVIDIFNIKILLRKILKKILNG